MPCRLAITSMSLGRAFAGHSLEHKLDMAQAYGYQGLELFHEDLQDLASRLPGGPGAENELRAAAAIRDMCRARQLAIVCLQPFAHYEGLADRAEHGRRLDKLRFWFRLARALGTDMVQVPCNFLPAAEVSADRALAVADLQVVADMGAAERPTPIRFVYEALCWGTRCDTWEASWDVVRAVDRPNFGLCLDTFNIAGRIYADPAAASGRTPDADAAVRASLARLTRGGYLDVSKVFYVQVVDAERLARPLVPGHELYDAAQPCRMSWSRACRLFYGEADRGAYLPVADVARAIFKGLGFEGWVSLELFNRRMADREPGVPRELAERGAVSWAKLARDMGLDVDRSGNGRVFPVREKGKEGGKGAAGTAATTEHVETARARVCASL